MFQMLGRWRPSPVQHFVMLALSAWIFAPFSYRILAADSSSQSPVHTASTTKKGKAERPPFDLTYVPSDANGVLAIRPSAIFADPAMKPLAGMVNQSLDQLRQFLKLSAEPKLAVEDIEEIIAPFTIKVSDTKPSGNHSLMTGMPMIRITHDFDWLKLMRQLDPKLEEVRHGDRVYYRCHLTQLMPGVSAKATLCFFMPDKRSLAFPQGKAGAERADGRSIQRPNFAWDKGWKRVEHGLIAVAMDNRWTNGLSKEEIGGVDPVSTSIAQNAVTMVAGVDWKEGVDFRAYLVGKDDAATSQMMKNIKNAIAEMRHDLEPAPDFPKALIPMVTEFWKNLRIRRQESTIRVRTKTTVNLADLARFILLECKNSEK